MDKNRVRTSERTPSVFIIKIQQLKLYRATEYNNNYNWAVCFIYKLGNKYINKYNFKITAINNKENKTE